jgi:outer membrane protein
MKAEPFQRILAAYVIAVGIVAPIHADTLGGELFIGAFSHSPSGGAAYTLPFQKEHVYDIRSDLGWSDETDIMLSASFEHPLPVFPNIKIAYAPLYNSGNADVTNFSWGSITLPKGEIASDLELDITDLTAYYEVLDNDIQIDVGLTLRNLNGTFTVTTLATYESFSTQLIREELSFNEWIPMFYGKAAFRIPSTNISLRGSLNYFNYDDTTHYDYTLSARYTFMLGIGLEGGYRHTLLQTQSDILKGMYLDIDFSGFYAAAVWEF